MFVKSPPSTRKKVYARNVLSSLRFFCFVGSHFPLVAVNAVLHSPRPFNCRRCVLDVVLRAATKWVLVPLDLHIFSAGRKKSRKHSTAACARKVCLSTNSTHTPTPPPTHRKLEEIPLETEKKERTEIS